ncbi:MAG: PBP1A family penicillin-binding protein [Chloroflexota bacterium]
MNRRLRTMLTNQKALVFLPLFLMIGAAFLAAGHLLADLPSLDALHDHVLPPTTQIFDRHGRLLYEIMDPQTGKHSYVPLEEIPLALRQATIATEDATFYDNPGVDLTAIVRALWINLRGGEVLSGGSTITQQLARNLLLSPSEREQRTLGRKMRESILAWRMARHLPKDEILELYLNQTYYGNLAYGVQAAAQAYFGKHVSDLDLAECALFAGLPQAPALYNPLEHPAQANARQRIVLELMHKAGYITDEDARLASSEVLRFAAAPFPIHAPHFVMYVRGILEQEYGLESVYRTGLRVYTTLDLDLQERSRDISRYRLADLNEEKDGMPGANAHNAALVAIDPGTGEILVMLGSPDYFDPQNDGAVNCTLTLRQPGSAIKPLTYAAAFAADYTPATMLVDVRTAFPTREGNPYVPINYDHRFHGPVLLRQALGSSMNVIAVKVLQHIGVEQLRTLAKDLGITTLGDDRFGLALTLGGGEVSLLELTAAYAAFANGGHRIKPMSITRIEDQNGQVIFEARPEKQERVLDPRVAYLIADILSDDTARIPAFGERSMLKLSRPAAVKTGTTTDWRDNWTVGFTPGMAVGVWVGNADNTPMRNISGISGAAPIWHDFVEETFRGTPVESFQRPSGIVEVEICPLSGLLPGLSCPHRRRELFIAGTEPTTECNLHRTVPIDITTGLLATKYCPAEAIVERTYIYYPSEAIDWARGEGLTLPPETYCYTHQPAEAIARPQPVLPRSASPEPGANAHSLRLTEPDPNLVLRLSTELPIADQRIELAAHPNTTDPVQGIYFLVDDEPLVSVSQAPYRIMWQLSPGQHTIQAKGYTPEGVQLESQIVEITVLE